MFSQQLFGANGRKQATSRSDAELLNSDVLFLGTLTVSVSAYRYKSVATGFCEQFSRRRSQKFMLDETKFKESCIC